MLNLLLIIVILGAVLNFVLDILNAKYRVQSVPEELLDIYDNESYLKQQSYAKINTKIGLISSGLDTLLIVLMLVYGIFAQVSDYAHAQFSQAIPAALLYFGILMFASDILHLPFSIYRIFVIEEQYGFNKMTAKLFILDKLKSWLLGAVLGGGILALIMYIYEQTPEMFPLYAWLAIAAVMIFMTMFYSDLIVPLFNKQTPLESGELRDAIEKFAQKAGFSIQNIYVTDGSKRSTKANAYFTGFGSKKRIVLYDTLINQLDTEEIVAVLAHEIGHYKKKHSLLGMVTGLLQTAVMLYIFGYFASNPDLARALGAEQARFELSLTAFSILYTPLSLLIGLLMNIISRKNEYAADAFANMYGLGENLISSLKKMSKNHLSNLTPHPLYVFFNYSHPTLYQRLKAIRNGA